jgi:acyl-CoA thioesterase-1
VTWVPRTRTAALLLAAAVTLSACSSAAARTTSEGPGSARGESAPRSVEIVALGDSVPAGTACGCTPFPQLTGARLADASGAHVEVADDATPGWTTADVLEQLTSDSGVRDDVQGADVVEIEIGANDVERSTACGLSVDCYRPDLDTMSANLLQIVRTVRALSARPGSRVVLIDYWNVWLGGSYARAQGTAYVAAATALTGSVDAAVASAATATGSAYVDLRTEFLGPDHQGDETALLASDGDHPNALGHTRIADAVMAALQPSSS